MEIIAQNWEVILIATLLIDKVVALTPTPWDDLIWTGLKAAILKLKPEKKKSRLP